MCNRLKEMRQVADPDRKAEIGEKLTQHLDYVTRARDAMTAKTNIPNDLAKGKSDDVGMPLTAKLMGVIAYGYGWWGFWSFPEWAASSNLTLTALCKVFRDVSGKDPLGGEVPRRGDALPKRLDLQMDNTAKDNKNHYLLGFCGMLVAEGVFEEVRVFFLPVGHTHQVIDQTFSLISKKLSSRGAYSLPDLMEVTGGAWSDHRQIGSSRKVNERFNHVLDFRRLLRYDGDSRTSIHTGDGGSKVHKFAGLGTNRQTKR